MGSNIVGHRFWSLAHLLLLCLPTELYSFQQLDLATLNLYLEISPEFHNTFLTLSLYLQLTSGSHMLCHQPSRDNHKSLVLAVSYASQTFYVLLPRLRSEEHT